MQDAQYDYAIATVITQIVKHVRSGAEAPRGKLHVEGPQSIEEIVAFARPDPLRIIPDHLGCFCNQSGISIPLYRPELPSAFLQDVDDVVSSDFRKSVMQSRETGQLYIGVAERSRDVPD